MRLIKTLSLAIIAVLAATAFISTGSATASVNRTVLCKVNEKLCKKENLWGKHVTIKALSTLALLLGTVTVKCHSDTTILAEVSDTNQILGKITSLNWSNCKGCTTATTTTLPTGTLLHTFNQNGLLHTTSKTVVSLTGCPLGISCTATANTALLTFTGGNIGSSALAEASEVPVAMSGIFCGSEGKWDAGPGESEPYFVTRVEGETGTSESAGLFVSLQSHA